MLSAQSVPVHKMKFVSILIIWKYKFQWRSNIVPIPVRGAGPVRRLRAAGV